MWYKVQEFLDSNRFDVPCLIRSDLLDQKLYTNLIRNFVKILVKTVHDNFWMTNFHDWLVVLRFAVPNFRNFTFLYFWRLSFSYILLILLELLKHAFLFICLLNHFQEAFCLGTNMSIRVLLHFLNIWAQFCRKLNKLGEDQHIRNHSLSHYGTFWR